MIKRHVLELLKPIVKRLRPGNVIMIHIGRCGSTVVAKLLNQHSRIYWSGELYQPIFQEWRRNNPGTNIVGGMPDDAVNYLQKNMINAFNRYYGFEIKPYHFKLIGYSPETFIEYLDSLGFNHFIFLDRKNRLRKIISNSIARQIQKYHINANTKTELTRISIDPNNVMIDWDTKSLVDHLSSYDEQTHLFDALLEQKNVLRLSYEQDVQSDPKKAYCRICEFLGLPPENVSISLSRTNPYPVRDMLANFDEVSESLRGTPYEWMLYD